MALLVLAILASLGTLAWGGLITFANMMSDAPGVQEGYGSFWFCAVVSGLLWAGWFYD